MRLPWAFCPTGHFMPVIDTHAHSQANSSRDIRSKSLLCLHAYRRWWRSKRNSPAAVFSSYTNVPAPRFEPCGRSSAELTYGCLVIMSLSLFCGNDRDHSTMKKSRKFYTTVHDGADFPLPGWAQYELLRDELFTITFMGLDKGMPCLKRLQ